MADAVETRLEYWTSEGWHVGHAGVPLLHPDRYVERLAAKGKVGRATVLETGEVFQVLPTPEMEPACVLCDEHHALPHDGGCLL